MYVQGSLVSIMTIPKNSENIMEGRYVLISEPKIIIASEIFTSCYVLVVIIFLWHFCEGLLVPDLI